jgi:hypothetical protein
MIIKEHYPLRGWNINGENVLPPSAFSNDTSWLFYLHGIFPVEKLRVLLSTLTNADDVEVFVNETIKFFNTCDEWCELPENLFDIKM